MRTRDKVKKRQEEQETGRTRNNKNQVHEEPQIVERVRLRKNQRY